MSRAGFVLPALFIFVTGLVAQQTPAPTAQKNAVYAAIPVDAAKTPNPVKSTPESLATGKKWWTIDCAMCHGKNGDGKGQTAGDMKLTVADFTDAATLKDRTDGELFYIIKNGYQDMPPEGPRIKTEEGWDLVNYVRSLVVKKPDAEQKSQP
jgi:mono/diheme cytochrome c family protein